MSSPAEAQFVTDAAGNRVGVLLGVDRYRELLEAWEELDAIRCYDEAKASGEEPIPLDEALREIDEERQRQ